MVDLKQRKGRLFLARRWLFAFVVLLFVPLHGYAQEETASRLRLDLRLGAGRHDANLLGDNGLNLVTQVALRTRGPIVVGASAGFIHTVMQGDYVTRPGRQFNGEWVWVHGGSKFDLSPRFGGLAGFSFHSRGTPIELTAEGGLVRATHDLAVPGDDDSWQPWIVGSFAVRGSSGMGVQLGIGRYRARMTYHSDRTAELVKEHFAWSGFGEVLFSVPIN
jgi:hypothetical protein